MTKTSHRLGSSPWWRHQMETFSALLAICAGNSPVSGEFTAQRSVTRSFDVFFDLRMNELLSKHLCGYWLETPSCPLWHQSKFKDENIDTIYIQVIYTWSLSQCSFFSSFADMSFLYFIIKVFCADAVLARNAPLICKKSQMHIWQRMCTT